MFILQHNIQNSCTYAEIRETFTRKFLKTSAPHKPTITEQYDKFKFKESSAISPTNSHPTTVLIKERYSSSLVKWYISSFCEQELLLKDHARRIPSYVFMEHVIPDREELEYWYWIHYKGSVNIQNVTSTDNFFMLREKLFCMLRRLTCEPQYLNVHFHRLL